MSVKTGLEALKWVNKRFHKSRWLSLQLFARLFWTSGQAGVDAYVLRAKHLELIQTPAYGVRGTQGIFSRADAWWPIQSLTEQEVALFLRGVLGLQPRIADKNL